MSDPDSTNWLIQLFVSYRPVVDFFQALLAPVIAITVVYIAYQQHKTNKQRLQHELYDKRMKVYNAATDFIYAIVRTGKAAPHWSDYAVVMSQSVFLFGDDIRSYVTELSIKGHALDEAVSKLAEAGIAPKEKQRATETKKELLQYFEEQKTETVERFKTYLQLT